MKKECEIVQDLLFGYQDKTLHEASKELVEEHLKTCEDCRKIFSEMQKEEDTNENNEEIDYLKNINKKVKKKNKLLIIVGVILGIIVLLNIGIFAYYYSEAGKVQIYLNDDIKEEQIENIKNLITNIDENAKIKYFSKEDSLNQMKEKFKSNENLLSGYGGENNPLPAFLEVDTSIENAKKIETKMQSIEGVKKITGSFDSNPYLFMFSKVMVEM